MKREVVKPNHILLGHSVNIKRIVNALRKLIKSTISPINEKAQPGWHSIGFHHPTAGYICGIFPFENHVKLYFEHGAHFPDPSKILEGNQKQVRTMTFTDAKQIPSAPLKKLLLFAIQDEC